MASSSSPMMKVFELAPAVDRLHMEQGEKIETLELCGESLYVGSSLGRLRRFRLREEKGPDGRVKFVASRLSERDMGQRSSVTFVRSASALSRLLVLCDGSLSVLSVREDGDEGGGGGAGGEAFGKEDLLPLPLSGSSKLRGAQACCVNENPFRTDDPFAVQMCLAKKKQAAVISITETRLVVDRVCDLSDQVLQVSMDGAFVCAALASHYVVLDVSGGGSQDLFPHEGRPAIARVAREEFLLSAPGGLGMFVTSAGVSERPPIQWGPGAADGVAAFAHHAPHVVALGKDAIAVYSVIDQQPKQSLHFKGGRCVGNFDGRLLVASAASVYRILPIPVETQIRTFLEGGRLDHALSLAESSSSSSSSSVDPSLLSEVRTRAGFSRLSSLDTGAAADLLLRGRVDPREVIVLFPRLLPASSASSFARAVPPLHQMADVYGATGARGDEEKRRRLDGFLAGLLHAMRREGFPFRTEIDTALVKLLSRLDFPSSSLSPSQSLAALLSDPAPLYCDVEESLSALREAGKDRRHELATLYFREGLYEDALSVWAEMLTEGGEVEEDASFPGCEFFVEKLLSCGSAALLWRHADLVLRRDHEMAVRLFSRPRKKEEEGEADGGGEEEEEEWQRKAVTFLHNGGYREARLAYLEHLVLEGDSQVELFHTQLASAYMDTIIRSRDEKDQEEQTRKKFRSIVVRSPHVQASFLLSRLEKEPGLEREKAVLYGKMGDHEKALRTLAVSLSDASEAERYCDEIAAAAGEERLKKTLLHTLLKIYLQPQEGTSDSESASLSSFARDLFNRRAREMDAAAALGTMPDSWALDSVRQGLETAVAASAQRCRNSMVMSALSKADNVNAKMEKSREACESMVKMATSSYCMFCRKQFHDPDFARFPNGIVVHLECAGDPGSPLRVCPVTGKVFSTEGKNAT